MMYACMHACIKCILVFVFGCWLSPSHPSWGTNQCAHQPGLVIHTEKEGQHRRRCVPSFSSPILHLLSVVFFAFGVGLVSREGFRFRLRPVPFLPFPHRPLHQRPCRKKRRRHFLYFHLNFSIISVSEKSYTMCSRMDLSLVYPNARNTSTTGTSVLMYGSCARICPPLTLLLCWFP